MATPTLQDPIQAGQQGTAATLPPINAEVLFSRCMGNASFALALLDELEAHGKQHVEEIDLQAANDRPQAAAEAAHSLKGAAAIIGAEPVRGLAADIEAAGRACEVSRLFDLIGELRGEMDRCLAYIPALRSETQRRKP